MGFFAQRLQSLQAFCSRGPAAMGKARMKGARNCTLPAAVLLHRAVCQSQQRAPWRNLVPLEICVDGAFGEDEDKLTGVVWPVT